MKTRVALAFPMLLFVLASIADAQLKAGSPEDEAFTKIEAEKNSDARLALLLQFESKFPTTGPKTLATVYLMTMDIYSANTVTKRSERTLITLRHCFASAPSIQQRRQTCRKRSSTPRKPSRS
jgi:hypothetical protein